MTNTHIQLDTNESHSNYGSKHKPSTANVFAQYPKRQRLAWWCQNVKWKHLPRYWPASILGSALLEPAPRGSTNDSSVFMSGSHGEGRWAESGSPAKSRKRLLWNGRSSAMQYRPTCISYVPAFILEIETRVFLGFDNHGQPWSVMMMR